MITATAQNGSSNLTRNCVSAPVLAARRYVTEYDFQRCRDVASELVLDDEDILKVPIKALGLDVKAVSNLDELRGSPKTMISAADAPFEHRRDGMGVACRLSRWGRRVPNVIE